MKHSGDVPSLLCQATFPPSWEGTRFWKHCCLLGFMHHPSGTKPEFAGSGTGGDSQTGLIIDGDSSELSLQPPNGRGSGFRKFLSGPTKTKGKGNNKTRFVFPCPQPPFPPGRPCRPRPQHVFSTCCRWRRTSVAFSQGTTLAEGAGVSLCAS